MPAKRKTAPVKLTANPRGSARVSKKPPLTPAQLKQIDAYWRASNYPVSYTHLVVPVKQETVQIQRFFPYAAGSEVLAVFNIRSQDFRRQGGVAETHRRK